jgi:hypothetical protein
VIVPVGGVPAPHECSGSAISHDVVIVLAAVWMIWAPHPAVTESQVLRVVRSAINGSSRNRSL